MALSANLVSTKVTTLPVARMLSHSLGGLGGSKASPASVTCNLTEARQEGVHRFFKQELATVYEGNMSGGAVDFAQIVRGDEDGHLSGLREHSLHQLVPH